MMIAMHPCSEYGSSRSSEATLSLEKSNWIRLLFVMIQSAMRQLNNAARNKMRENPSIATSPVQQRH
jgi:hypothetical protein